MKRLLVSLCLLALTACGANPYKDADTIQQKGYATYGTFVIVEEQAAALVQDPAVSGVVKLALRRADAKGKPIADALHNVLVTDGSAQQIAALIKELSPILIELSYKK